jgi:hypothetical protein
MLTAVLKPHRLGLEAGMSCPRAEALMNKYGSTLALGLLCGCLFPTHGNAGLNDRTKKLLQSQALSRPQTDTAPKNTQRPAGTTPQQGGAAGRAAAPAPALGNFGPTTGVPARKN